MSESLRWFIFIAGLLFSSSVLYLLLKRRINERHSLIWLSGVIAILILSANPEWFDRISGYLGVHYPPSLFFLIGILILALVLLYQSIQISILYEKVKELAQYVALMPVQKAEHERLMKEDMQKEGK